MRRDSSNPPPETLPPPTRDCFDPGGVVAALSRIREHLATVARTASPVVTLVYCRDAVIAIGAAAQAVTDHALHVPPAYPALATRCQTVSADLGEAIVGAVPTHHPAVIPIPLALAPDPTLPRLGPNILGIEAQLYPLARDLDRVARTVAARPTAPSSISIAGESAVALARLITAMTALGSASASPLGAR
ncbi:hypothetical protein [Nocardia salmonicida]|uniref:hypothetical protein n=1 Tax=Nocardia salmonicida TaxID=53431 RepID=UPI00363DD5FB